MTCRRLNVVLSYSDDRRDVHRAILYDDTLYDHTEQQPLAWLYVPYLSLLSTLSGCPGRARLCC